MIQSRRVKHSEDFTETSEFYQTVVRVLVASVNDLSQLQMLWVRYMTKTMPLTSHNAKAWILPGFEPASPLTRF